MMIRNARWLGLALAGLLASAGTPADDIRPDVQARPFADEKCIEQCDVDSDQCMQEAEGDRRKMQACDDQYSKCLRACEAR